MTRGFARCSGRSNGLEWLGGLRFGTQVANEWFDGGEWEMKAPVESTGGEVYCAYRLGHSEVFGLGSDSWVPTKVRSPALGCSAVASFSLFPSNIFFYHGLLLAGSGFEGDVVMIWLVGAGRKW